MSIGKLKKYIDKNIGEHAYICVYDRFNNFLCEGIVSELRDSQLWKLLDEENVNVARAFSGKSKSGRKAIILIINVSKGRD